MLTNHAPLAVAEEFAVLRALHPGRVDAGMGRGPVGTTPRWSVRSGAVHRRLTRKNIRDR